MNTKVDFNPSPLFKEIKQAARQNNRTVEDQILHWVRLGKVAEENPELSFEFLQSLDVELMDKTESIIKTTKEV